MQTEHYYTYKGRQRAVFFGPEVAQVRFGVEVADGDSALVEVTYEPMESVKRGQGRWEAFGGGLGGSVEGVTAMRLNIGRVSGWVKLLVERN